MTRLILIHQHGGSGGGMAQAALNFDYDALREAVTDWQGTRSLRKTAEAIGINHTSLRAFLLGGLVTWETVGKLCAAMGRDEGEFLR